MLFTIVTIVITLLGIFLYNIPILGAFLCVISLILCVKLIRGQNFIIGFLGLTVASVTTLLSVIIILITFSVIEPLGFDMGYNNEYTRKVNGMFYLNNFDEEYQRIKSDIKSYITRKTTYGVGSVSQAQAIAQLFKDSSDVNIYYSTTTVDKLKNSVDDKTFEKIKPYVALRDSEAEYYLLNFDKLYDVVGPIYKLDESKRKYWLIDTEGNIYLNVEDLTNYIHSNKSE